MPNCFAMTKIGESEPAKLVAIDEEICAMLGIPSDPVHWVHGWYDSIGLSLALGKSLDEIVKIYADDPPLDRIAVYLRDHYTVKAWYQHR